MGFKILEHTSDLGLEAHGKTLKEAFTEIAKGLFVIIAGSNSVRQTRSFTVSVSAESAKELLVAWLNQLIFLYDSEKVLFGHFKILEFDHNHLRAKVSGEALEFGKHEIQTYVKAATYHNVSILENETATVRVYFDV